MPPTVLIGFAEALSAPEVAWSLLDHGFRVAAFGRRGKRAGLRHSRYLTVTDVTPPESDAAAALREVEALLSSLQASNANDSVVLFPLDDASIWLSSRVCMSQGRVLAGPSGPASGFALDKCAQNKTAQSAGFQVFPTKLALTSKDVYEGARRLPAIMKPAFATREDQGRLRKGRFWICGDRAELDKAVQDWAERTPLLIQPLVSGTGEGIFGLATAAGVQAWSAHRRLRMMNPHGSGSSAAVSQAVPAEIKRPVEEFLNAIAWRGIFMIEVLRDHSGALWFMEFNGRPWGSIALSRRQGLEYPAWNVKLALDLNFQLRVPPSNGAGVVCRNLGRELMHLLFVLRGPQSKAVENWPSFWKSVVQVTKIGPGDRFYNWRRSDPNVFLHDCFYTVWDQVFKKRS